MVGPSRRGDGLGARGDGAGRPRRLELLSIVSGPSPLDRSTRTCAGEEPAQNPVRPSRSDREMGHAQVLTRTFRLRAVLDVRFYEVLGAPWSAPAMRRRLRTTASVSAFPFQCRTRLAALPSRAFDGLILRAISLRTAAAHERTWLSPVPDLVLPSDAQTP